ncbi:putative melibiase [Naematelia encephala]|uniref:Alpha-galactosidase n=1 Tax=Naematelia encephala TaxID=71784 RepID=A0A1Y2BJV6_9TREE|nr:putative melibiase [Naematelia encephala]
MPVVVDGKQFFLHAGSATYAFHVDPTTGDLIHDHYGPSISETIPADDVEAIEHGVPFRCQAREFPDSGRGDFRLPAIHIRHAEGYTVTAFKYVKHEVVPGKPKLEGLPATWGGEGDVETLVVYLKDELSGLEAELNYSVFVKHDAFARSCKMVNRGEKDVVIERAASFCVDMPSEEYEMVELCGDWAREARRVKRKVDWGTQGFQSAAGYSSHYHNPFFALVNPGTTESFGPAWGFNLVYTGSHATSVEKTAHGYTRVLMGLNPLQLSWMLGPGETFTTPECVSVYASDGLGGMSRRLHALYRHHLSRSKWTLQPRPALLNNWEATYFDFDGDSLVPIAQAAADVGIKLFVMDDGWFGRRYPRTSDSAGLGDWMVNSKRFPNGLKPFVDTVKGMGLKFGIWVEPEMVNPKSELYETHPDWILHAGNHARTTQRNQFVLNLGLVQVQDYIIGFLTSLLSSATIEYVKWDNNRGIHEMPSPSSDHRYMLGLYRVLDTLTTSFPDVLFEGCASGGGRFDAGILYYFPQTWTSDDTDAEERLSIQFGTSLAYPPSAMGCHVSAVPNHQTHRTTPFIFRAHVALMGGSFGFELDPTLLSEEEKTAIPDLIRLSERISPLVIEGDMYRLSLPIESNWPAAQYLSADGKQAVVFAYQVRHTIKMAFPALRLQGLDKVARYEVDGKVYSGATLMGTGLKWAWSGDHQSRVVFVTRI